MWNGKSCTAPENKRLGRSSQEGARLPSSSQRRSVWCALGWSSSDEFVENLDGHLHLLAAGVGGDLDGQPTSLKGAPRLLAASLEKPCWEGTPDSLWKTELYSPPCREARPCRCLGFHSVASGCTQPRCPTHEVRIGLGSPFGASHRVVLSVVVGLPPVALRGKYPKSLGLTAIVSDTRGSGRAWYVAKPAGRWHRFRGLHE